MKYLLFSDVHWSVNTSIVRSRGEHYSTRLELLIKSMNWLNELAVEQKCDAMICLGDFFDKSVCTDEELSALSKIKWNKLPTKYLVGNHESSVASLEFSTASVFRNKRVEIISEPMMEAEIGYSLLFLPYITEDNRKILKDYITNFVDFSGKPVIVFSHNDIAGIQYGGFTSKTGFGLEEITENCCLFLNGHLHNSEWISDTILNVGSMTAHNFTNDSYRYEYGVWTLDTKTLKLEFFENPYSLNFYKIDINTEDDIKKLYKLKSNAVLSVKCLDTLADMTRQVLDSIKDIVSYKLILYSNVVNDLGELNTVELSSDHLLKFKEFILSRDDIENVDIFKEELLEVCK